MFRGGQQQTKFLFLLNAAGIIEMLRFEALGCKTYKYLKYFYEK
jgi:hypothetical protein